MATSLWSSTLRSAHRATSACTGPSPGLLSLSIRHKNIPHSGVPFRRWEATAAIQERLNPTPKQLDLDPGSPAAPLDAPVGRTKPSDDLAFSTLKGRVSHDTIKAITVKPFKMTHMTPVQAAVLPLLPQIAEPYNPDAPAAPRTPRDLLVRAKTGTGKTLAFLVPAIEARLKGIEDHGKRAVRDAGLTTDKHLEGRAKRVFTRTEVGTLIISPTRELATQIANEALRLSHHQDGFEVRLFVGGVSKRMQMRDWMKGRRDIVVGTPGRLRDLLENEPDVLAGVKKARMLILDECDTLLDMGFRDDLDAIIKHLPPVPERQTFLFSATLSRAIQQVARASLAKDHLYINTVSDNTSPVHAHVPQFGTVLPSAGHQIPHVLRVLAHDQLTHPGKSKIILFLPTTKQTQLFATFIRELSKTCLPAGRETRVYEIHSKRTQESRTSTSESFRNDKSGCSILVTSDVSARGVDYPGVTRVVQVGMPAGTEQYIHRVGRTGRAGTVGRGDLVLLPWEVGFLTWQLTEVPMKPVTTNEVKAQVKELAAKFDENPQAFFKDVEVARPSSYDHGRNNRNSPRVFKAPFSPVLDNMEKDIGELLAQIDEDAIKETLASILGYYIPKSPELRVQKSVILEGCKDWTTQACGLPAPPYISDMFLQKLGMSDNRTKHFGKALRRDDRGGGMRDNGPSWAGRGAQRNKGMVKERPDWARSRSLDEDDPRGAPEEYRSSRYTSNRPMSRSGDGSRQRNRPSY
ncbi:hypothetical protein JAAARDRAFT_191482 [Jaapia argillacea MUCL 33604]|uniref:ATP-dependent RNA helicase n=1 Tax=Jaapia argillacea MUCL 33604 TaxID=933084 RepID=A0A067QBT6_9AGAM|nr:hypothetical protein JAAARDRAFT_191482 [Jaapia argillacea MUCL 33604]